MSAFVAKFPEKTDCRRIAQSWCPLNDKYTLIHFEIAVRTYKNLNYKEKKELFILKVR